MKSIISVELEDGACLWVTVGRDTKDMRVGKVLVHQVFDYKDALALVTGGNIKSFYGMQNIVRPRGACKCTKDNTYPKVDGHIYLYGVCTHTGVKQGWFEVKDSGVYPIAGI